LFCLSATCCLRDIADTATTPTRRIDYILARVAWVIRSEVTLDRALPLHGGDGSASIWPSDHHVVLATLEPSTTYRTLMIGYASPSTD
jgi:hypothetical protein